MATVQSRIQLWTGPLDSVSPLDVAQILNDSVRQVIMETNPDALTSLWTELTDSGSGVDTSAYRVLEGRKLLKVANWVSPSWRTNTNITASKPAMYTLGTSTYVIPDGGTILAVSYPTVTAGVSSVTNVADPLLYMFTLKASEGVLDHLLMNLREDVTTDITLPTAPTAPSAPSISYSDATAATVSTVSIAALPTAPTYSAPTLASKPTVPTVSTLDLTLKLDGVTSLSPPTAPSAPTIAYSDATAATISATSVAALPTVPTYNTPSFGGSLSLPTLPGDLDLSDEIDGVTALDPPTAPSAPTIAYSDATAATASATTVAALGTAPAYTKPTFTGTISDITGGLPAVLDLTNDIDAAGMTVPTLPSDPVLSSAGLSATTISALSTAPAYTKTSVSLTFTDWDTFEALEDPEMMREQLSKVALELQEAQAQIQDERMEFEKEAEAYRADLQHKIEQARLTVQEQLATLSAADQMALQDYAQELSLYDRELAQYNAKIQVQLQEQESNFSRAIAGIAAAQKLYLELYGLDIQNEVNEFQKEVAVYQQDAQHKIEQARLTAQEALADMRASTDVAIQNEARTLEGAIADYDRELARYESLLKTYTAEVQRQVEQFNANYRKAYEPWADQQAKYLQEYQLDISTEADRFRGLMEDHLKECDRIVQQAQITQQEAVQQAQLTTSTAVQNELQTLAAAVQDYEQEINLFRSKSDLYQREIEAVVTEFVQQLDREIAVFQAEAGADVARFQAETADARSSFEQTLSVYQATLERNNLAAQIARQEAEQTARQATEVSVQNEAQTLAAAIGDYQQEVARFSVQVNDYASQVRATIDQQQSEEQVRAEKMKMYAKDRQRVQIKYAEAKINYEHAYGRLRPVNVRFTDF